MNHTNSYLFILFHRSPMPFLYPNFMIINIFHSYLRTIYFYSKEKTMSDEPCVDSEMTPPRIDIPLPPPQLAPNVPPRAEIPRDDVEPNEDEIFLASQNLSLFKISGDGNCLFRALSHQLMINDVDIDHAQIRNSICDYLEKHPDYFKIFYVSSENFKTYEDYVKNLRRNSTYGDHFCLVAFNKFYNIDVEIYRRNYPTTIINNHCIPSFKKIKIYYYGNHYDSLIDLE